MGIVDVNDPADPRIADYRNLRDVRLRRQEQGLFMAEGMAVVRRAQAAGCRARSALVSADRPEDAAQLAQLLEAPVYVASAQVVEGVAGFDVHRGVLAAMHRPPPRRVDDVLRGARRVVVLEDLADPSNVGAIFRSAAALGIDAVLVSPRCGDPLYRRAVRVSMGAVFQVPWATLPWPAGLDHLRTQGFTVYGLGFADDAVPLPRLAAAPPTRLALVVGSEGAGLTARSLRRMDGVATIPMHGGVSSLNVGSAAAIAMWALRVDGPLPGDEVIHPR